MTNTHIDKEAREAILFLATMFDNEHGTTTQAELMRTLTPLPADGESSPKPEAGEQRVAVARVDPPDGARPYRHLTRLSDLHDVPDGTLLYAETAPLPTPQPAEPKVMPQPSEQAKGAEWMPPQMEKFDAMARRMDDADMTRWDKNGAKEHVHTPFGLLALGLKERDTQWRTFIESERAQHKAEMEAVKKGASR